MVWTFQFASDAFTDPDGDTLTYSATLSDDSALPGWVTFDAGTRTFTGEPPAVGTYSFKVTATDPGGLYVSDIFDLIVDDGSGTADWWDDSIYDSQSIIADFRNERYTLPPYGSEMILTGDFAADTDWTKTSGWTIASGIATVVAPGSVANLSQTISTTAGSLYELTFTVTVRAAGTITPSFQGGTAVNGTARSAAGTFTQYFTALSGNNSLRFQASATGDLSIDNVSLKEVNLTATGATRGSELLDNDSFASAAVAAPNYSTGWVMKSPAVGTETMLITGGELRVNGDGTNEGWADQSFTTVAGTTYEVTYENSNVGALIKLGTSQGGTDLVSFTSTTSTAAQTFRFTATGTTTWVRLGKLISSGFARFESFSVKEVTAIGVYPKREATFDEIFAYTAASDTARTFTASNGTIRNMFAGGTVNLVPYSQDFDVTTNGWNKTGLSITANAQVAPDGTTTADTLVEDGANSRHRVIRNPITTTADAYTFSAYVKAGTRDRVKVGLYDSGTDRHGVFNVATGAVLSSGGGTAAITSVGSGWYRCEVRFTPIATTGADYSISALDASSNDTYVGTNGAQALHVWGAQLEYAATASTYVPTTTGVNEPRLTYATQATNLFLQSQTFDNGSWTKGDTSVTADNTAAPDGTTTADKIVEAATTADHWWYQAVSVTSGTTYTMSCYVKAAGRTRFSMAFNAAFFSAITDHTVFDLSTATVVQTGSALNTSVRPVGNGWYRCTASAACTSSGSPNFFLSTISGTARNYAGDGTSGLYVWGAQLEAASYAGPYAATTTASASARARQLRLENAATNNAARSQEFGSWTASNVTVTADQAAAPDGTTTMDRLDEAAASSTHAVTGTPTSISYTSGTSYTASVYAKAETCSTLQIVLPSGAFGGTDSFANFDLSSGVVGTKGATATSSIVSVGGGIYRCIMTMAATATTTGNPGAVFLTNSASASRAQSFAGTNRTLLVWGYQNEASAFATDYIPTTSASVTRAIETCRFSPLVEAIIFRSACTMVARFDTTRPSPDRVDIFGNQGSDCYIYVNNNTQLASYDGAGVVTATATDLHIPSGAAVAWDGSGRSLCGNGGTVGTGSSPIARTQMYLARAGSLVSYGNGYYDYVAISPDKLPDATLQALAVPA